MTAPFPRFLAVAGVAVALVLAGCGDDDADTASGTTVATEDTAPAGTSDTDAGEATATTMETTARPMPRTRSSRSRSPTARSPAVAGTRPAWGRRSPSV